MLKQLMLKIVSVMLLFVSLSSASIADWLDGYAQYVKGQARKHNVPGYAFVIYEQGKAPRIYTYGKTHKAGKAITQDTVFRLASVSKTFTGILSAKLASQDVLALDMNLTQLLPGIDFDNEQADKLTLAHIIGQSSGYMPNAYDNIIEANYTLQRVLGDLGKLEPLCDPGKCYTYQNALFGAIEYYLNEQDTSYHRQLQEQIFNPLGMETASVGKSGLESSDSWARPHIAISRDNWRLGRVENDYYRFSPAAGVNVSIKDMTRWLQALLGEFPTVMPPWLIEQVTTPRVRTKREIYRRGWRSYLKDAHYGLGWRVYDFDGVTVNYHGGWVKGYRADVAFIPEHKVGFAMLMNAESNIINSTTAEFIHRYLEHQKP